MKNTDMNILELYPNNTFKLYDSYSFGHQIPKNDIELGGNYDLLSPSFQIEQDNFANVSFYRLYDTNDKYDSIVKNVFSDFLY